MKTIGSAILVVLLVGPGVPRNAQAQCRGDCDDDGFVTVNELVTAISIALGETHVPKCRPADGNGDERITVDELIDAVYVARHGCVGPQCAREVARSLADEIACNDRALMPDAAPCPEVLTPGCVGTLVTDAVALGYGPNNPATSAVDQGRLQAQLACQTAIGAGVAAFVNSMLGDLIDGDTREDAEQRARALLDPIETQCAVITARDAGGVILPAVGPQCAAAIGAPGDPVDAVALRDCLGTLLGLWVNRFGPAPEPLRPNILFILTDDQRWDTTDGTHGPGGAPIMPRTRAALADQGVEFANAFLTTPVCCPSRSSILSGQYAFRHGVYTNSGLNGGADDFNHAHTVGAWLAQAGYRTAFIGKYLNGYNGVWNESRLVPPGWTLWNGMRTVKYFDYEIIEPDGRGGYAPFFYGSDAADYSTDVLREKAKNFISTAVAAGEPFFVHLSFKAPHGPFIAAPRHEGLFDGLPDWRPPNYDEADVSDKPTWLRNTPRIAEPGGISPNGLDQTRIDQLEMLQAVDEAIGGNPAFGIVGLMEHLRALGVADDTLVVFMADNGWHWGEHRTQAKLKPYEESIRTPLLVRYPKLAPLRRLETRLVANIDLAPTFAELAGAQATIPVDGVSLVRLLDATAPEWRTDVLTEGWPSGRVWATVREAQWKYTELPVTPGDPATAFEFELYDLVADPYELDNVATRPEHAARMERMAARLRAIRPNWPDDSDAREEDPEEEE